MRIDKEIVNELKGEIYEVLKNIYSFELDNGRIYLYGDNVDSCTPYIDGIVNSVEDICIYCKAHKIKTYYKPNGKTLADIVFYLRILRLSIKYKVHGSWKDLQAFASKTE